LLITYRDTPSLALCLLRSPSPPLQTKDPVTQISACQVINTTALLLQSFKWSLFVVIYLFFQYTDWFVAVLIDLIKWFRSCQLFLSVANGNACQVVDFDDRVNKNIHCVCFSYILYKRISNIAIRIVAIT